MAGADPGVVEGGGRGGEGLGGQTPPPFVGPPNFIKRGKNVASMRTNTPRFSSTRTIPFG